MNTTQNDNQGYNYGYNLWNKIRTATIITAAAGMALMYALTGNNNTDVLNKQKSQKNTQKETVYNKAPQVHNLPINDSKGNKWIEISQGIYSRPYTTNHKEAIVELMSQLKIEKHRTTIDHLIGRTRVDPSTQQLRDRFDNMVYGGHISEKIMHDYFKETAYLQTLKQAGNDTGKREMYVIIPENMLRDAVKASMKYRNK